MIAEAPHLGELEMSVLEYVWEHGPCDIRTAYAHIGPARQITHNTVQSTFRRLFDKGLLSRQKRGRAHVYEASLDRSELTELLVAGLVEQVAGADVTVALEAFVNLADRVGEGTLATLEELVAARRRARDEEEA